METINALIENINISPSTQKWTLAVFAFVLFDLVTGLTKAYKNNQQIKAGKMKLTTLKTLQLGIAILVTEALSVLFVPGIPLTKIVAGYICAVEAKSIFENIEDTTGINLWKKITGSGFNTNLKNK